MSQGLWCGQQICKMNQMPLSITGDSNCICREWIHKAVLLPQINVTKLTNASYLWKYLNSHILPHDHKLLLWCRNRNENNATSDNSTMVLFKGREKISILKGLPFLLLAYRISIWKFKKMQIHLWQFNFGYFLYMKITPSQIIVYILTYLVTLWHNSPWRALVAL